MVELIDFQTQQIEALQKEVERLKAELEKYKPVGFSML